MSKFKKEYGDWTRYCELDKVMVVDHYHYADDEYPDLRYHERMQEVYDAALDVLQKAQAEGYDYVLFTHGWSTSRPGNTTSRSQIRKLMRSSDATPYIIRRECIQHDSVFLAAIRSVRAT